MKICPNCNTACSDSDKFCTACGTVLPDAPAAAQSEPPKAETRPVPVKTASANGRLLKNLASSKLALKIAIAFTLIVLLAVVSSYTVPRALAGYVDDAAELIGEYDLGEIDISDIDLSPLEEAGIDLSGLDTEHVDIAELIVGFKDIIKDALSNSGSIISSLYSNAAGILIAVSMWLIFGSAKNAENPVCSGTGFTILLVLKAIALVGTVLLTLLCALGGAVAIGACSEDFVSLAVFVTVLLAVICIIALLYRIGLVRTLKRFNAETKGISDKGHISGFASFILAVKGVFKCIGALLMLALVIVFGSAAVPGLLSAIASAVAFFGCSKFISKAKKELTA